MLKKIIQILVIIILLAILSLIVIFVFNPANLRTKIIGNVMNAYLTNNLKDYAPLEASKSVVSPANSNIDKNPLLNAEQEKTLENFGVDVSKLPTEITPAMQTCFTEALGQERASELVAGATPTALEIIKAGKCLGK